MLVEAMVSELLPSTSVSTPAASPGAGFEDPQLEQQYQRERLALTTSPAVRAGGLLLIGSLTVFVFAQMSGGGSLADIALLVAVLVVHEGGHWLGMRVFGYRDVKMFFIPFFGAAVSGKRGGVATWKEAVVLLLGPLPGIFLGLVFLMLTIIKPDPLWRDAGITLLLLNGFNLLPLGGLDGGRLFQRVLFSRQRHLEVVFLVLAGVSLLALAFSLRLWFLAFFAYLGLVVVPRRYRILRATHRLRREGGRRRDAARRCRGTRGFHAGPRSDPRKLARQAAADRHRDGRDR